jgi:acyl-CoA thioester hydrolase
MTARDTPSPPRTGRPGHPLDALRVASTLAFRVRFCETDLMGIVHHANYFQYFEMGRVDWLRKRGVTYAKWASAGTHLPVVDASARYRQPSRFDDELRLTTLLGELRSHSLRFDYRLRRTIDDALIAEGSTRLACIDERHRLIPFTDSMVRTLLSGELAGELAGELSGEVTQEKSPEPEANA